MFFELSSSNIYNIKVMDKIYNIVIGIGSILSIMPSSQPEDYSRFMPAGTDAERMGEIWEQVGNDIKTATEQFSSDHNITSRTKQ
jgi:hypothetical protein